VLLLLLRFGGDLLVSDKGQIFYRFPVNCLEIARLCFKCLLVTRCHTRQELMSRALEPDARAVFLPQHGILPLEQSHTFSRVGPGQQALAACLGVANLLEGPAGRLPQRLLRRSVCS
jgi:hypothetical protein